MNFVIVCFVGANLRRLEEVENLVAKDIGGALGDMLQMENTEEKF